MIHIAILTGAILSMAPVKCHHYSTWNYPHPQRCEQTQAQAPSRTWFVEMVLPSNHSSPDSTTNTGRSPVLTPEVIQELNEQLMALKYTKYYKQPWINQCLKAGYTTFHCETSWDKLMASCAQNATCPIEKETSHD